MNKELTEKLKAIREYPMALQAQAQAGDAKKLSELVMQKDQWVLWRNYEALYPYMTEDQKLRSGYIGGFEGAAPIPDTLIDFVNGYVSRMLADLDDIEREIGRQATGTGSG